MQLTSVIHRAKLVQWPLQTNSLLSRSRFLPTFKRAGRHVVRGAELPRMDRQRLQKAGFIEEVVRGWYLVVAARRQEEA